MKDVAYCPETIKCWKRIETWTLLSKRQKVNKVRSRKLRRIIVQANLDESNIYAITFEECQVRLDES